MPPAAVAENVFELQENEQKQMGIKTLPANLGEAIDELEKDEFIKGVLGKHITDNYIRAKRAEWTDYCSQVTRWEIED